MWVVLQTCGVPSGQNAGDEVDVLYGVRRKLHAGLELIKNPPPATTTAAPAPDTQPSASDNGTEAPAPKPEPAAAGT